MIRHIHAVEDFALFPPCSAMLFPLVVTGYVTWWFLEFFDNFFSPFYEYLFGFHVFGLGFITSMLFIFSTGENLNAKRSCG